MEFIPRGLDRLPAPDGRATDTVITERLCSHCRIPFEWVFSTLMNHQGSSGEFHDPEESPDLRGTEPEKSNEYFRAISFSREPDCACRLLPAWDSRTNRRLFVQLSTKTNFREAKDCSPFNKIELHWIYSPRYESGPQYLYTIAYTHKPQPGVESCQISPSWIDYDWLREKINHCILGHGKCHSSGKSITKLRLIDIEGGGRLEDFEQEQEVDYIALSYVWGTSSYEPDDRKRIEPEPLIKDAMLVTQRLGYRYLWVDRYCIKDGEDHKQLMINQMDRVYSKACATIIASTCNSAQDHLPCVHGPPQGEHVEFGEVRFVKLGDTADEVLRSQWASRGWTYQEGYLSQRRLIFTPGGVIFLCNQECFRETQRGSAGSFMDREPPHNFFWMLPSGDNTLTGLKSQIIQYSQRNLTFEEDLLRAFQGVMRHYETSGAAKVISHLWGIPFSYDTSANTAYGARITIGLVWRHFQPKEKRNNFPSWSWTGWNGGVDCFDVSKAVEFYSEQQDIDSSICDAVEDPAYTSHLPWHIEVCDGDRRSTLSQYVRDHTAQVCHSSEQEAMNVWQPRELWITSYVLKLRYISARVRSNPTERILVELPMGDRKYLYLEPYFDREASTIKGDLGVILPMQGRRFWQKDQSCSYSIIILHRISDAKFERAGLLRFFYGSSAGRAHAEHDWVPRHEWVYGHPNEYPFLHDATWETICLV